MELRKDVGTTVRRARAERGVTRDVAAEAIDVPEDFLADIEDGRFEAFGSSLHAAAYVRVYARYLGLDPDELVEPEEGIAPVEAEAVVARRRVAAIVAVALLAVGALVAVVAVLTVAPGEGSDIAFDEAAAEGAGASPEADGEDADADTGVRSGGIGDEPSDDAEPGSGAEDASREEPTADEGADAVEETPVGEGLRVQVLDGANDNARLRDATSVLEGLGYEVVFVDRALQTFETTTVLRDEAWAPEAQALMEADGRFAAAGSDPGFNVDAELHVIVGLDWPEP